MALVAGRGGGHSHYADFILNDRQFSYHDLLPIKMGMGDGSTGSLPAEDGELGSVTCHRCLSPAGPPLTQLLNHSVGSYVAH